MIFREFARYPKGIQMALLDMVFNLGLVGFRRDFPKLIEAVERRDWARASAECWRKGIGYPRNAWAQSQFDNAAVSSG